MVQAARCGGMGHGGMSLSFCFQFIIALHRHRKEPRNWQPSATWLWLNRCGAYSSFQFGFCQNQSNPPRLSQRRKSMEDAKRIKFQSRAHRRWSSRSARFLIRFSWIAFMRQSISMRIPWVEPCAVRFNAKPDDFPAFTMFLFCILHFLNELWTEMGCVQHFMLIFVASTGTTQRL